MKMFVVVTGATNAMDGAVTQITELLIGLGLPGVGLLFLGFGVVKLYNRNQELHQTLYDVGRESVKTNEATAAALNRLSDMLLRGKAPE